MSTASNLVLPSRRGMYELELERRARPSVPHLSLVPDLEPEDFTSPAERLAYLAGVRREFEASRRLRGVPVEGTTAGRMPLRELLAQIS